MVALHGKSKDGFETISIEMEFPDVIPCNMR